MGEFKGTPTVPAAAPLSPAVYPCEPQRREEMAANARLIAAAPDLLAAAQEVLAGLNAKIDAAIRNGAPVPVYDGIAAMHTAIDKALNG